ncbi:MAG: HD domain-containing phosphohydrolase [Solirubrobacterales bacterium]
MGSIGRGTDRKRSNRSDHRSTHGERRAPKVMLAFAVYTAVAILVAILVVVLVVREKVEDSSIQTVTEHTGFVASAVIPGRVTAEQWRGPVTGTRLDALDKALKRDLLTGGVIRVSLYNADGLTIYSSERSLIGKPADRRSRLQAAIRGANVTGISSLKATEVAGDDRKVIESFAPVKYRGADRTSGVLVFYTDYALVASSVRDQAAPLTIALLAVMLAFYLALLPILRRTTRALAFSNVELRRHANELKENLAQRADIEDRLRETIAELERSENQLALSQEETIIRLSIAVESRDADTGSHIERMGQYCALLAEKLNWSEDRGQLLRIASPLHDVGKIAIPDGVLQKPGSLTDAERLEMERHAEIGHRILAGSDSPLLDLAARIALTHHEKWDGSGYPKGLAGDEIPVEGRIAAIADVFDALTSDRVYRPAMPIEKALSILAEGRGSHFDPVILDTFFDSLDEVLAIRNSRDAAPEPASDDAQGHREHRRHGKRKTVAAAQAAPGSFSSDADGERRSLVG